MKKRSIKQKSRYKVERGIWTVLLCVFLLSSAMKAVNIHSFALETRLYMDAYFWDLKSAVSNLCGAFRIDMAGAVGVCAMEMTLALLAIRRDYRRTASAGFFLMLSFFVYLTGVNLFFPTIMGSIESCGCFGELIHFSPLASFIKSAVLWMLSLVLLASTFKRNTPRNTGRLFRDKYLYVCIATSLVLPLYSLWFFEVLSHIVYLIGYGVLCLLLAICMYAGGRQDKRGKPKYLETRCEEIRENELLD